MTTLGQHHRRSDRLTYLMLSRASHALPWLRRLLPRRLDEYLTERAITGRDARVYLEEQILGQLAAMELGKVLSVGCRRYTKHYGRWFRGTSTEFWTVDINPEAARWGEPGRHRVADVRGLGSTVERGEFDAVLLVGIFGYGVNDEPSMTRTVAAIHEVLAPGGILMVGCETDFEPAPDQLAEMRLCFDHGAREPLHRSEWQADGLAYDFYTARDLSVEAGRPAG